MRLCQPLLVTFVCLVDYRSHSFANWLTWLSHTTNSVTDFKTSSRENVVTHQTCLVLWTWRKLADETNVKNAPKICWKIVLTWGIQTALAIHITQSQDYPYAKNEYKIVVAIYRTRMTILMQEMNAIADSHLSHKNHQEAERIQWIMIFFWYEKGAHISKLTHALYSLYSWLQKITARYPVIQSCTENGQKNWPINLA